MQPGSVIVDVSIDQGGCVATLILLTFCPCVRKVRRDPLLRHQHARGVPSDFNYGAHHGTLPYVLQLAHQGLDGLRADPGFGKGVNTYRGFVALITVPATLCPVSSPCGSPWWTQRRWWYLDRVQYRGKQGARLLPEKALRCSCPI